MTVRCQRRLVSSLHHVSPPRRHTKCSPLTATPSIPPPTPTPRRSTRPRRPERAGPADLGQVLIGQNISGQTAAVSLDDGTLIADPGAAHAAATVRARAIGLGPMHRPSRAARPDAGRTAHLVPRRLNPGHRAGPQRRPPARDRGSPDPPCVRTQQTPKGAAHQPPLHLAATRPAGGRTRRVGFRSLDQARTVTPLGEVVGVGRKAGTGPPFLGQDRPALVVAPAAADLQIPRREALPAKAGSSGAGASDEALVGWMFASNRCSRSSRNAWRSTSSRPSRM